MRVFQKPRFNTELSEIILFSSGDAVAIIKTKVDVKSNFDIRKRKPKS